MQVLQITASFTQLIKKKQQKKTTKFETKTLDETSFLFLNWHGENKFYLNLDTLILLKILYIIFYKLINDFTSINRIVKNSRERN